MSAPLLPYSAWYNTNQANEVPNAVTTLQASPMAITLSENINNFKFNPTLTGTGFHAYTVAQVVSVVPVGAEITIETEFGNVTLTASLTPSVNEFWTAVSPPTPDYFRHVVESIADTLSQYLIIKNNYTVAINGTTIGVTAKQYGTLYDMNVLSTDSSIFIYTNVGVEFYESQKYIDYQGFAQVFIGDEVYSQNVNKYNSSLVDEYIIDSGKFKVNATFPVVGNFVEPILPIKISPTTAANYYAMDMGVDHNGLSVLSLDAYGKHKRILIPYFVTYGDSFKYVKNGQRKKYVRGVSAVKWVQLGAYDMLMPYNMMEFEMVMDTVKGFRFLTSCPAYKEVTYDSHEFIQMIVKTSAKALDFNVQFRLKTYDGFTDIVNVPSMSYSGLGGNLSIDVSPGILGIKTIENFIGKEIKSYEVRIRYESSLSPLEYGYSDFQSYKFDRTCYADKEQLLFLNEYGAWDTIEMKGAISELINSESTNILRSLPWNANTLDSVSNEVSINIVNDVNSEYSLNSGLVSNTHLKWLKKIVESGAVYIWDKTVERYRSIILTKHTWNYKSTVGTNSMGITFRYGATNNTVKR